MEHDEKLEQLVESLYSRISEPRVKFSKEFEDMIAKEYQTLLAQNINKDRILKAVIAKIYRLAENSKNIKPISEESPESKLKPIESRPENKKMSSVIADLKG